MNIKKLTFNSILIAVGFLLHQITPPLFLGMKPDFSLIMLFIIIFMNKEFKSALAAGLATGIFTAMTTGFPGGQIPNLVDKLITTIMIYLIVKTLIPHVKDQVLMLIVMPIGTLISGTIFLTSAALMAGLPGEFIALFKAIVIPAMLINAVIGMFLFNIVNVSMKRSNYNHG